MLLLRLTLLAVVVLVCLVPLQVRANVVYDVSFDDPGGAFSSFYAPIESHLLATDIALEIEVGFADSILRAFGRSNIAVPIGTISGRTLVQESAGWEIATGFDPTPAFPDILIGFQPHYLQNELWFDPNPFLRTAPVPGDRTDAMSVVLHELAHAFGFNGFRDQMTGVLNPLFLSGYDALTTFAGPRLFFVGERAQNVFGGPVPLTFPMSARLNNYHHWGTQATHRS
jgi:hypothetical protein